jgi:hypothetical protein
MYVGLSANFLVCSPQEAAAFKAGKTGYIATEADLVFRAALLMAAVELGAHPGGKSGQQQLEWILKVCHKLNMCRPAMFSETARLPSCRACTGVCIVAPALAANIGFNGAAGTQMQPLQ